MHTPASESVRAAWETLSVEMSFKYVLPPPAQNAAGTAHFAYYDASRLLSFVWAGDVTDFIEVSYGGYGQPSFAFFEIINFVKGPPFAWSQATGKFQQACEFWIQQMESSVLFTNNKEN